MPKIERLSWANSFKRAFQARVRGTPDEAVFRARVEQFLDDPFASRLRTHKLTGKLEGLWAFSVSHACRVVFQFVSGQEALFIDIGSHDEVY